MSTVLLFDIAFGKEGGEAKKLRIIARKLMMQCTDYRGLDWIQKEAIHRNQIKSSRQG